MRGRPELSSPAMTPFRCSGTLSCGRLNSEGTNVTSRAPRGFGRHTASGASNVPPWLTRPPSFNEYEPETLSLSMSARINDCKISIINFLSRRPTSELWGAYGSVGYVESKDAWHVDRAGDWTSRAALGAYGPPPLIEFCDLRCCAGMRIFAIYRYSFSGVECLGPHLATEGYDDRFRGGPHMLPAIGCN